MNTEDTYEFLKKIDKDIAQDYLFTKARNTALDGILNEVRVLLNAGPGQSVLTSLKDALGPVEKSVVRADIRSNPLRIQTRVSKEEREEVKRRLLALGASFSPKDSSKRLLAKLNRIENVTDWVLQYEEPSLKPAKSSETSNTSNNNIVNGW